MSEHAKQRAEAAAATNQATGAEAKFQALEQLRAEGKAPKKFS